MGGSPGGGSGSVSTTAAAQLAANASRYTWIAATSSAQTAAGLELSTGRSVMAIGGFTGSDNAITLARFEQLVAQGKIHYYVAGGGGAGGGTGAGERYQCDVERLESRRRTRHGRRCHPDDRVVGHEALQVHDGRRYDGVRPDAANRVARPTAISRALPSDQARGRSWSSHDPKLPRVPEPGDAREIVVPVR